jgi:hypothetical protein
MKHKTLKSILFSVVSIMIVFVPMFFVSAALVPCGGSEQNPCAFSDFFQLINNIINFLLFNIAFPLSALAFAVAGWMYLTAGGDTGKIKSAHEIFKNVAVGLIIALSAWLVVNAILTGLGIKDAFKLLK